MFSRCIDELNEKQVGHDFDENYNPMQTRLRSPSSDTTSSNKGRRIVDIFQEVRILYICRLTILENIFSNKRCRDTLSLLLAYSPCLMDVSGKQVTLLEFSVTMIRLNLLHRNRI